MRNAVYSFLLKSYPLRMGSVDLDKPPRWWNRQSGDHWTAFEARRFAGTKG